MHVVGNLVNAIFLGICYNSAKRFDIQRSKIYLFGNLLYKIYLSLQNMCFVCCKERYILLVWYKASIFTKHKVQTGKIGNANEACLYTWILPHGLDTRLVCRIKS